MAQRYDYRKNGACMETIKLHLGCGDVRLNGWENIDLNSPLADFRLDLRNGLPHENSSVSYVYSEHFIEHMTRAEAKYLLEECCRVLKPEGTIRLSTPDLKFLAATYLSGKTDAWGDLWRPANSCHLMNEGMRFWGHQFLYDAEELKSLLADTGFTYVTFQQWGKSNIAELNGLESRPFHNEIIVEAQKQTNKQDATALANYAELQKQALRIENMVNIIADQTSIIEMTKAELKRRELHIKRLEKTISNQLAHIDGIETEIRKLHSLWHVRLMYRQSQY